MIKQIALYIAISVFVSLGIGYGAGHYIASNKAERDIAAIRAILEEQDAQKKRDIDAAEKAYEEYLREREAIRQQRIDKQKRYK